MRKRSTISIIYAEVFVFVEKNLEQFGDLQKLLKLSYDQENRKACASIRSLVAVHLRQ